MPAKKTVLVIFLSFSFLAFAAETLKIDFRYRLNGDDGKNHLNWQTKTTKDKQAKTTNPNSVADRQIKDKYDATTGASKNMSTKYMREVQFEDKKRILPKGLYSLLLFAVTPSPQAKTDTLTVTSSAKNEKELSIFFVHRGNAYKITTNEKGQLDMHSGFTIAENLAVNTGGVFTIKPELMKNSTETEKSGAKNADWNLIDWDKVQFMPDRYDGDVPKIWNGKLTARFKDNILTITGTLKKIDRPKIIDLDDVPIQAQMSGKGQNAPAEPTPPTDSAPTTNSAPTTDSASPQEPPAIHGV